MAKRRYSYRFLTMGGRRFVQLTPERFNRLYESEQENIIKSAEVFGEDLRLWDKKVWESLSDIPEVRDSAFKRAMNIATGAPVYEIVKNIGKAYYEALKQNSSFNLLDKFLFVWEHLTDKQRDMLIHELPDIHAIYMERGRSYTKGRMIAMQQVYDDARDNIDVVLDEYTKLAQENIRTGADISESVL